MGCSWLLGRVYTAPISEGAVIQEPKHPGKLSSGVTCATLAGDRALHAYTYSSAQFSIPCFNSKDSLENQVSSQIRELDLRELGWLSLKSKF